MRPRGARKNCLPTAGAHSMIAVSMIRTTPRPREFAGLRKNDQWRQLVTVTAATSLYMQNRPLSLLDRNMRGRETPSSSHALVAAHTMAAVSTPSPRPWGIAEHRLLASTVEASLWTQLHPRPSNTRCRRLQRACGRCRRLQRTCGGCRRCVLSRSILSLVSLLPFMRIETERSR